MTGLKSKEVEGDSLLASDLKLPDGDYPFVDQRLPLGEMVMVEAPPELERLLKDQALANGTEIIRDSPVEITCVSDDHPDACFLIWWPYGTDRLHLLVPKEYAIGRA